MKTKLIFNIGGAKPRRDYIGDVEYLVVPTVAMVEGVLNGSEGPLLYREADMAKSVKVWNHRPLIVYHPRRGTSAATPENLAKRSIGITMNSSVGDGKLKMESWIDIAKCKKVDKRVLEMVENGQQVEVSTGLDADCTVEEGEFNGAKYKGIVFNFQPDHLAILPDQVGASSIAHGAGLLQNAEGDEAKPLDDIQLGSLMAMSGTAEIFNAKSYQDVIGELYSLIQARFGYRTSIHGVFDGYFVYITGDEGARKMYKQTYAKSDKEVTLGTGDPEEVYFSGNYVTVQNGAILATVTNSSKEIDMKKSELVTRIIANSAGAFEESDRTVLEAMTDAKLGALDTKFAAPAPVVTQVAPQNGQQTMTTDQLVALLPPELGRVIQNAKNAEANERERLVPIIMNARGNGFTEAFLKDEKQCSIDLLRGIAGPILAVQNAGPQGPAQFPGAGQSILQPNYAGAWTQPFGYGPNGMIQNAANKAEEEDEFERASLEFEPKK